MIDLIFILTLGIGILGYAIACQKCMEERKKEIIEDILEDLKDIQGKCDAVKECCNNVLSLFDRVRGDK